MNVFFNDDSEEEELFEEEMINEKALNQKKSLISPSDSEFEALAKKLKERLDENQGETIYSIGTGDGEKPGLNEKDMEAAMATLTGLADTLGAECLKLRSREEEEGFVSECLVRIRVQERDFMEIRVAVVGNVDAGKSTLLGVLTHVELDNGRGQARRKLFRHKHEMESGRTSSVGNDILGFDCHGNVVNKPEHGSMDWVRICQKSSKVITFIDLAGHERYLKTTVFGMTGHAPDFGMLMIGANAGMIGMTKEHLGLALALGVPVFVVVTKIDMCPPNILQQTLQTLNKILKSPGCRKIPVLVQNMDDVVVSATNFTSERMCPVFQISNVTGENLHLLKSFLNLLSPRMKTQTNCPAEFQIDETFTVPGVGTVVSGTTLKGVIKLGDNLLLGPDLNGGFISIVVKSIHRKRMAVKEVRGGQTASFALKKFKRSQIRKGMVMVSPLLDPQSCWEFEGEILVLHHPTTISVKYQAMVHVGSVRQTATILTMSREHLRTGDKALCRFRFIKNPEYIRKDSRLVFREGRTKAVGTVTTLFPYVSAVAQNLKTSKPIKKQQQQQQKQQQQQQQQQQDSQLKEQTDTKTDNKLNGVVATPSTSTPEVAGASSSSTPATSEESENLKESLDQPEFTPFNPQRSGSDRKHSRNKKQKPHQNKNNPSKPLNSNSQTIALKSSSSKIIETLP